MPYPAGVQSINILKEELQYTISISAFSLIWKQWIRQSLQWIPKRGPQVKGILCEKNCSLEKEQYLQLKSEPCLCSQAPETLPRVKGCLALRTPENLAHFFDPLEVETLTQNMKNERPTPYQSLFFESKKMRKKTRKREKPRKF